jgi:Predicted aminopeptidases
MLFSEEAERFLRLDCDRLVCLAGILASRGLPYSILKTGSARHLAVRLGSSSPALVLVAHYDRAPGSPGALDNSCACLQLVDFAQRVSASGPDAAPSLLFVFTDEEEAPGSGIARGGASGGASGVRGASSQGSFALSRALAKALSRLDRAKGRTAPAFRAMVFDVTGRGDRLLLSTAPAELLDRNGLSDSPAAAGYRELAALARRAASGAGLAPPVEAKLPWSDDLGLTLGGIPALAVSLLPDYEARALSAGLKPRTWDYLHSPEDLPGLATESAFGLMSRFLDSLAQLARS